MLLRREDEIQYETEKVKLLLRTLVPESECDNGEQPNSRPVYYGIIKRQITSHVSQDK